MGADLWWMLEPVMLHHIYWHRKKQFLLNSDCYSYWTLFAVEKGLFDYDICGQHGSAGPFELVVCPPGEPFGRWVREVLSFHFLTFQFYRSDGTIAASLPENMNCRLSFKDTNRLGTTFNHLREAAKTGGMHALQWRSHLLKDIWGQYVYEQLAEPHVLSAEPAVPRESVMELAGRIIREKACTPLSLAQVASQLGLTPVQLTRKYKAAYGISPSEHVTALRMKEACSLLTGSTHSLETIAEACGYENGFYFSRIFTKRMGMSPSRYRKTYQI